MNFYNLILSLLHKFYRSCPFVQMLVNAVAYFFAVVLLKIDEIKSTFYFDLLTEDGVVYWENMLAITPTPTQTLADRRSKIHAKWLSDNHNSITLIRNVCNSWKNGEVIADFVNGKIRLTFVGEYGIPDDLSGLLGSIDEIKPAHLPYETIFKYLLIKDIHEVKTIAQMEQITLKEFAFGQENI